jgi:hydrogenase-4 component F
VCVATAIVALLGGSVMALILPVGHRLTWGIAVVSGTVMVAAAALISIEVSRNGPAFAFNDWVYVDALGVIVADLVGVVGLLAIVNSLPYIEHELGRGEISPRRARQYYVLVLAFLATMFAVPVLNNLGAVWIAIEATTIVSALLVSIHGDKAGLEAAWKYLIIGSVGIAFALFGTMMTFYAAEPILGDSSHALNWTTLRSVADQLNPEVMRLAFVFILVGYGTKAGLAPMHTWLPDAHSQAPSPVSGLLSGVLLKCALVALLRMSVLTDASVGGSFRDNALMAFGIASILVALPFIFVQGDLKRLLAYSSVENIGIIALAVGIGGPIATYAAILHIVGHSLTKSSLFFSAGSIVQAYGTRRLHRLRGLVRATPMLAAASIGGVVAISGFPPFALFVSEYGLMSGAFGVGRGGVAVAGMALVALAGAAILFQVSGAMYGERRNNRRPARASRVAVASALVPLVLATWVAFAPPTPVRHMLRDAAAVMEV